VEVIKETAKRIVSGVSERIPGVMDDLALGAQDKVEFAAATAAEIAHMKLAGQDTAHHERALEAIVSNWDYEKSSVVSRALWDAVEDVFGGAGAFLGGFASAAIEKGIGL